MDYSHLKEISIAEDWFKAYEINPSLFVLYEPRHYEETIATLVLGAQQAALIDTGCGIGNLRQAVEQITHLPVMVINTHTHLDHLGSNRQFDDIAMFDHPLSRRVAEHGVGHDIVQRDILADPLITKPWPTGFDPNGFDLPPFQVSRWLREGDRIDLGGRDLEVIFTPGEAVNHICLLDRTNRILFCGDILLHGPVWTHLDGGSLTDLAASYRTLMASFDAFDHLMPGHNVPWLDKDLLPEALAGVEHVITDDVEAQPITDPWNTPLKQYFFDRISFITR